jgi:hypothetical protein
MLMYVVKWSVESDNGSVDGGEYVSTIEGAWNLWYRLSKMSKMEEEHLRSRVSRGLESSVLPLTPQRHRMSVHELGGREVVPELGMKGMLQYRDDVRTTEQPGKAMR